MSSNKHGKSHGLKNTQFEGNLIYSVLPSRYFRASGSIRVYAMSSLSRPLRPALHNVATTDSVQAHIRFNSICCSLGQPETNQHLIDWHTFISERRELCAVQNFCSPVRVRDGPPMPISLS